MSQDYENMHWKHLKAELEARGLKFESKEQAVDALLKSDQDGNAPIAAAVPAVFTEKVADGIQRFNPKAEHTQIFGEVENAPGARFSQGGRYFNNAGEQVG